MFKLLLMVLERRPSFCTAQAVVRLFGNVGSEGLGRLVPRETGRTVGEEKGPLQVLSQIKCERVKGDCVRMRLLKEGDEKNRRDIERA